MKTTLRTCTLELTFQKKCFGRKFTMTSDDKLFPQEKVGNSYLRFSCIIIDLALESKTKCIVFRYYLQFSVYVNLGELNGKLSETTFSND